jgi:hypothetical protein
MIEIFGRVETNINKNSEIANRLADVNKLFDGEIVVEQNFTSNRKKFKKKYVNQFNIIHRYKDGFSNNVIAYKLTEREVELYLLGMINGVESVKLGLIKNL